MAVYDWCTTCQTRGAHCSDADNHRAQGRVHWRADYEIGHRVRKTYRGLTKKEVEKIETLAIADYERGIHLPQSAKPITFADLADKYYNEHCLVENRNPKAHTLYRIKLAKKLLGHKIAKDIKRQELKDLRGKLRAGGWAPATVNRFFNDLKAIFYKGMEWELLIMNPCEFITKLEEDDPIPQFLTQEQINTLRRAANSPRLQDFMTVLLHTGARPSSIERCRWENGDVDFQSRTIWFVTYKGRKRHRYPHPIDDSLLEVLVRRASITGKKGPVFDMRNVGRLGSKAIERTHINDGRAENMRFTIYGLKHCYASQLLMNGASLDEVRRLLGHTDMKMVMKHYGHLTQEYLRKVQGRINLTPDLAPEETRDNTIDRHG